MKKRRCYIYTRVSTSMQVEGYSLEAQKERLRKYADFQEMVIVGEYSDEGKSGKSIEGRQEFMQMLRDIEEGKDRVEFVLVYKLSRFGRNAADVLNSLQRMQDFGVNLICVEDGIDSSKDSGKLMISVLSAVALSGKDTNHVTDLGITSDDRIKLLVSRTFYHIVTIFFQCIISCLRVIGYHSLVSSYR